MLRFLRSLFFACVFLAVGFFAGVWAALSEPRNACEGGAICEAWAHPPGVPDAPPDPNRRMLASN